MRRCTITISLVCLCILFLSSECSANPSVPIFFPSLPQILAVLVAVILIETWVFKIGMGKPYRKIGLAVGSANIVSTVLGYPLSLWAVNIVAVDMPSVLRFDFHDVDLGIFWALFAISVSTLILSFLVSVYLEYFIIRGFLRNEDKHKIRHLSYRANLITYCLLVAVLFFRTVTFPL